MKPIRRTNFLKFIFGFKSYMFRTVPLSIIRSFPMYTQQWYMSYRFASSLRAGSGWNCSQAVSKPVWHIPLLCVQWKASDNGQRNCPKHVEFQSKNKFEKISASSWFHYKKFITMHGHINVTYGLTALQIPAGYCFKKVIITQST
jgi:hypothetical protein